MDRLHVATLNIRNIADRWAERQGLIYADMAALQPDLLGLQEVVYVLQQDRLIGAAGEGTYGAVRGWAGRPEYGNSLLVRAPLVGEASERLDLGLGRSAHRVRVALPGGASVVMAVTHLHHPPDAAKERDEQAEAVLALARRVSGGRRDDPRRRLQRRAGRARVRADRRGRIRLLVPRGERRRARLHVAVGHPGRGHGHRR